MPPIYPTIGSWAVCPPLIHDPLTCQNSLLAGKKAGNFAESAAFLRKSVPKAFVNSMVCTVNSLRGEQGIILRVQGINSREQGWAGK
jgi:hypothetical protein